MHEGLYLKAGVSILKTVYMSCFFLLLLFFLPTLHFLFQPDVEMKAVSLLTSPPAGLGTLDPLPLRQDQWPPNSVSDKRVSHNSAHEEHSSVPPLLNSARSCPVSCWSPSPRIQGTLKDPEFQHNGGFCLLTGRVSVRGWKWLPCSILALMAIKNVVFVNGSFSTVSC